jgi:two-component system phosphate regulon response regulator PhoB
MVTARNEDSDVVAGLEIGADDYIAKPFSPSVLVARVRAQLRRLESGPEEEPQAIQVHELSIHRGRHEVLADDQPVDLSFTEFRILLALAEAPGWVLSRYQIVNKVRGDNTIVTDRSVDVHIANLRKKLGRYGKYVETVRGVGYRLRE